MRSTVYHILSPLTQGPEGPEGPGGPLTPNVPRVPSTASQLEQVVLFYPGFGVFLKTCVQSKMFFSERTLLVLKTVRAFEKKYVRSAFLNFKRLCNFCFEVRMFDFASKSRFSQKKNPPPFGSQMGGGCTKKNKIGFSCLKK